MSTELTIRLPESVLTNISTRAIQAGRSMEQVIVDTLQNVFTARAKPLSERERAIQALVDAGLVLSIEPMARRSVRHVSEKRRAELAVALSKGRPLSEIVIEDRSERL